MNRDELQRFQVSEESIQVFVRLLERMTLEDHKRVMDAGCESYNRRVMS